MGFADMTNYIRPIFICQRTVFRTPHHFYNLLKEVEKEAALFLHRNTILNLSRK